MAITTHDYYRYKPSLDAAIVVAILYSLAFMGTIFQFLRYRSWVWTVMVVASGSEFPWRPKSTRSILTKSSGGGWIYCKVYISQERWQQGSLYHPIHLSSAGTCLDGCSMLYCFRMLNHTSLCSNSNSIFQGRIVFHVVPKEARTTRLLWIPPRLVTPIFVACDIRKFQLKAYLGRPNSDVSRTSVPTLGRSPDNLCDSWRSRCRLQSQKRQKDCPNRRRYPVNLLWPLLHHRRPL